MSRNDNGFLICKTLKECKNVPFLCPSLIGQEIMGLNFSKEHSDQKLENLSDNTGSEKHWKDYGSASSEFQELTEQTSSC